MTALVAWMTGLSGAGKSTIAQQASTILLEKGYTVLILDGDAVRSALSPNLGFRRDDIMENDRRLMSLCLKFRSEYDVILVPKISPFREQRSLTRRTMGKDFLEIYVQASLATVTQRDPKGLYRNAREGRLDGLIGVAPEVPYEPPMCADLVLETESGSPESCTAILVEYLLANFEPAE